MKNSYPLVYTFLAFFFILLVSVRSDVIKDSCGKAAKLDPELKYDFCVATLEGIPKAKTATSTADLVPILIDKSISDATSVSSIISKLLNDKSLGKDARSALETCSELYSDAQSDLETAEKAFEAKDYDTANTNLSAALDSPETCEDGFREKELVSPLTKEDNEFSQLTSIPLAFVDLVRQ